MTHAMSVGVSFVTEEMERLSILPSWYQGNVFPGTFGSHSANST